MEETEAGRRQNSDYTGNDDKDLVKWLLNWLQRKASETVKQEKNKRTKSQTQDNKGLRTAEAEGEEQTPKTVGLRKDIKKRSQFEKVGWRGIQWLIFF